MKMFGTIALLFLAALFAGCGQLKEAVQDQIQTDEEPAPPTGMAFSVVLPQVGERVSSSSSTSMKGSWTFQGGDTKKTMQMSHAESADMTVTIMEISGGKITKAKVLFGDILTVWVYDEEETRTLSEASGREYIVTISDGEVSASPSDGRKGSDDEMKNVKAQVKGLADAPREFAALLPAGELAFGSTLSIPQETLKDYFGQDDQTLGDVDLVFVEATDINGAPAGVFKATFTVLGNIEIKRGVPATITLTNETRLVVDQATGRILEHGISGPFTMSAINADGSMQWMGALEESRTATPL